MIGLTGAALVGDDGLNAAADFALAEAATAAGDDLVAAFAASGRALVEARAVMASGDRAQVIAAAARFEAPIKTSRIPRPPPGRRPASRRRRAGRPRRTADRRGFATEGRHAAAHGDRRPGRRRKAASTLPMNR